MDPDYRRAYADLEDWHWWFTARRRILRCLLEREPAWRSGKRFLEAGVGAGANLYTLYPSGAEIWGMELDPGSAARAAGRGSIPVVVGGLPDLPAPLCDLDFDLVAMFDVLEHIADDLAALRAVRRRVRPEGALVLSVPAYQWLWGRQDIASHHFRRYSRGDLLGKLRMAGFQIRHVTYFNTFLLPAIAAQRLLARLTPWRDRAHASDLEASADSPLSGILRAIFSLEAVWLRRRTLPAGVSLYVSAVPLGPGNSL